jgi:DNA polymerase-3 subunit beta
MKISLPREALLEELQILQGIVEKRNTMPILANVLVEVTDKAVELMGTDLEVGLKTGLEAEISRAGSLTVNGKKLYEIIRAVPEGEKVVLDQKNDKIEIKAGNAEFKLNCQSREDFPAIQESAFERGISFPLEGFQKMIDRVFYAITQEQRYYLNGALLSLKDGQLELVSTDGHRLSYTSKAEAGLKGRESASYIVAKKSLNELRKMSGESVAFDYDENNLFFRVGGRMLISRIIDSKFPNYQAVIPKDNPNVLTVGRAEVADALRRVALLSSERSKGVKLSLEKSRVKLFSSNPEIGEARDEIGAEYRGQNLDIGFNAQYLLDFLTAGDSEKVVFEIKDENSAVLIRPEAEDEVKNIYVLMPMKL